MKRLKICIAASAGGHLSQLLLLKPVWQGHEMICVSTGQMVQKTLEQVGKSYIVGESNRQHPIRTIRVMWKCFWVVMHERPEVILSTGAAVGFLMCFFGKMMGARIIWMDSIANARKLSMSGRMIRPFADLILSQWPDVAEKYSNVEYAGETL